MSSLQTFAETVLIPAQLAFAMYGMGATLSVRDFAEVAKNPIGLGVGLVVQLLAVPLLALALTQLFDMGPGWAVGLLLVSVVPGGALSNLLTHLGRGNLALSISMTVAATVSCIVTIPLVLAVLAPSYLPADFALPTGKIVFDIFAWLLVPLVLGMLTHRALEDRSARVSRWAINTSLTLLSVIVLSSLGTGRIEIAAYGWMPPLRIVLFAVALAVLAPLAVRAVGRYDDEAVAVGIEVSVRNVGVALLLFQFFFPGEAAQGHVLYSLLFYSGISMFMALPLMLAHRRGWSPVVLLARHPRPPRPLPLVGGE